MVKTRDKLLNFSNISPSGNGNFDKDNKDFICNPPTSGQKWWAAVLLGLTASVITSPVIFKSFSYGIEKAGGMAIYEGKGPSLAGWLLMTIVLILVFRIILG